jgi:hypothetical protein
MDIGAVLKMVLAAQMDPAARQALVGALDGEGGAEVEAAIEELARALGLVDEAGDVDEERVRGLIEELGLEE